MKYYINHADYRKLDSKLVRTPHTLGTLRRAVIEQCNATLTYVKHGKYCATLEFNVAGDELVFCLLYDIHLYEYGPI